MEKRYRMISDDMSWCGAKVSKLSMSKLWLMIIHVLPSMNCIHARLSHYLQSRRRFRILKWFQHGFYRWIDSSLYVSLQTHTFLQTNTFFFILAFVTDNFAVITDAVHKKIYQVDLDNPVTLEPLNIANMEFPWGISYHPGEGKLYWSDRDAHTIRRASLDGSNDEILITIEGSVTFIFPAKLC